MSADNGIYLAKFKDGYRVAHAQSIDNCEYQGRDSEIAKAFQVLYFGDCPVLSEKEAQKIAFEMEKEIMESDFPILEYGISTIEFGHDFPTMTKEEAKKIIRL